MKYTLQTQQQLVMKKYLNSNWITHVINLVAHNNNKSIDNLKYLNLSIKDSPECDILSALPKIIKFINKAEEEIENPRYWFFCK